MRRHSAFSRFIAFFIQHKIIVLALILLICAWGAYHAPFNWTLPGYLERDPVPVDAIPDVGENQQIVFVDWMGRSAADVEQHITRPLANAMLATAGVKTVRASSMSGMSSVYIIFDETVDFHDARARVLERLASLPQNLLPNNVKPALGPDASPLGQVFWYTIEGINQKTGERTGGWDLTELRDIQDRLVRPALAAAPGIAEVAAVAHGASECRIDVDPEKLAANNIVMPAVYDALERAGADLGVGTFEINGVEYFVRALGALRSPEDIADLIVKNRPGSPVRIRDIGSVRRTLSDNMGGLDRYGEKAVGGVAVARYGENPMNAIKALRQRIDRLAPSLPTKTLDGGIVSRATIVPFYDRSQLIGETLYTLSSAIRQQILITIVVIVFMLTSLKAGMIVSILMPLSVCICFIMMRRFGVDANLVSLSGIAIAIGAISDMGIILCENITAKLRQRRKDEAPATTVLDASVEVGGAVLTAVATTIVGFLPVFALTGPEGKLFKPLAFTKTFCLFAAIAVTLTVLPALAHWLLAPDNDKGKPARTGTYVKALAALIAAVAFFLGEYRIVAGALALLAAWVLVQEYIPQKCIPAATRAIAILAGLAVGLALAADWMPLGVGAELWKNVLFTWGLLLAVYLVMELFIFLYPVFLAWCLRHKALFMLLPISICVLALCVWLGFERVCGFAPKAAALIGRDADAVKNSPQWKYLTEAFPGLGKEFMPSFDEGTFLYMPTVMPHASVREIQELINLQDKRFAAIPEVLDVAGKYGRAESALDPAPLSMFETIINYKSEYLQDDVGRILTFAFDPEGEDVFRNASGEVVLDNGETVSLTGKFLRRDDGGLIPDPSGRPLRQWRPRLRTIDDLWKEIERAGAVPGITGAPKLYPIEARMVMLQTGIRAPMGIKIEGNNIHDMQKTADGIESLLRRVPEVNAGAVAADRSLGRPYWEIVPNRDALAAKGMTMYKFEHFLEVAVGGTMTPNWMEEERGRVPIRPGFEERFRNNPDALARMPVPAPDGTTTPLGELAEFRFTQGPEMIASEGSRLVAYVVFDRNSGVAEVEAVEAAAAYLKDMRGRGRLILPEGVSYSFTGSYENQVRSERKFAVVLPLALLVIFLIIYLQFRKASVTFILFTGVPLAMAGGMLLLWLYGKPWFMGHEVFGVNVRDFLHVRPYNLSVAVWVGFLALFGIATDDGVVMATYLEQSMETKRPDSVAAVREAVLEAGLRRVRPCLMTTATTVLALLPVLTSGGRGSEIMIPMAIPSFGGMLVTMISMFIVPVCYCWLKEKNTVKKPDTR